MRRFSIFLIVLAVCLQTATAKSVLKEFFGKFNRYVFCQNTVEDISRALRLIESGELGEVKNCPLGDFDPAVTIENILKGGQ